MLAPVLEDEPSTRIHSGFLRCFLAMVLIAAGMVAENSASWQASGVRSSTQRTSSMKPMRSISSASSSTRQRSSSMRRLPRSMWSITRPGVPTITWAPFFSAFN